MGKRTVLFCETCQQRCYFNPCEHCGASPRSRPTPAEIVQEFWGLTMYDNVDRVSISKYASGNEWEVYISLLIDHPSILERAATQSAACRKALAAYRKATKGEPKK